MKSCRDKAQTFPLNVNVTYLPQLLALEDTIRYIFDRNNCLLPAYFIANEFMKPFPYHWVRFLFQNLLNKWKINCYFSLRN